VLFLLPFGEAYGVAKARMRGKGSCYLLTCFLSPKGRGGNLSHSEGCGYNFDPLKTYLFLPGLSRFVIS
jgi:hypothetical protein